MVSTLPSANQTTRSSLDYLETNGSDSPNQRLLPLSVQVNEQDHLQVGGCDVVDLVKEFGSPLYILDEVTLRTACQQYRQAFDQYYPGEALVMYASKAWNCLAVCAIATQEGLAVDVVSGGELLTALTAGVNPDKLYFHGNNKSHGELQRGIDAGCRIVVDNWHELKTLSALASPQTPATILLRITPGIECHTHDYIRTGHIDSKFGFDPDQLEEVFTFVAQQSSLVCVGLHAHIGSQIFELQPHEDLSAVLVTWMEAAKRHGLPISELDVGGGLGIRYTETDDPPSITDWAQVVCENMVKACQEANVALPKLICEPGRSLIGTACITAYTIGGQKTVPGIRAYAAVDGGMSDNPRPITYQSLYRVLAANKMSAPLSETVTLAGKHCESGDVLIHDAQLPVLVAGDIVAIPATGAYNYSMASNYNRVPRPAAVLVKNGEASLIVERETDADLIRYDRLPSYLRS
ncbi:diaminopimelate decarboxylase [Leptolyngbyaceae cyanobacterium CCMR0082]|uniref:Diaminopimelate decarboxylase n=2 Tax=Adonisia turfae TaxID=2950184 RepID=A0A6M0SEX1_9CYAN|nr:diaminopimelate decarboxylase [Adonisia turfae]MDV3353231.1 diaminopimelate decarboxylase [Leptothoe sp. LEGE 181152]NEZ56843.1 diaminopimelate decarboxylase [Adonisia turfae CCMR0081]NEZ67060.1 diaminopimelate decarboxylase [Adonisia turfae CCMR0082]